MVNQDGDIATGRAVKTAKDNDGIPIGKQNAHPLLDTREYECELEDGMVMRYYANSIAENMLEQCDDAGSRQAILEEIVNHVHDRRALCADNRYLMTKRGRQLPKNTTIGWKILCQWKVGSSDWMALKCVKDSNPIELAE